MSAYVNAAPPRSNRGIVIATGGLALFYQVFTGFAVGVLIAVIDPVMVNELKVPAILVGLLLGGHYFIEPIRTYIGSLSDRYGFHQYHRAPFIAVGAVITALTYPLIVLLVERIKSPGSPDINPLFLGLALLAFLLNGTGVSIAGTAGNSLLVDMTTPKYRGIVSACGWTLLIMGGIIGSVVGQAALPNTQAHAFDYATLYSLFFFITPGVLLVLAFLAVLGTMARERNLPPRRTARTHVSWRGALRVVSGSRTARLFFLCVFALMLAMFMRDILAPAYGGNVLKMTVKERAGLPQTYSGPLLLAMLVAGVVMLRVNKRAVMIGGLLLAALGCALQAVAAFTFKADPAAIQAINAATDAFANKQIDQPAYDAAIKTWQAVISGDRALFMAGLMVMGAGLGVAVPSLLALMMEMTDRANAALYMGTWGVAQAFGSGLSALLAGGLRDWAFDTFRTNPEFGYGLVLLVPAVAYLGALALLQGVRADKFHAEIGLLNDTPIVVPSLVAANA